MSNTIPPVLQAPPRPISPANNINDILQAPPQEAPLTVNHKHSVSTESATVPFSEKLFNNTPGTVVGLFKYLYKTGRAVILPFKWAADFTESTKLWWSGELEKAKTRNGADLNDNASLTEYHKSLLFNEANPDPNKLLRVRLADSNKHIFLFLGNAQTHATPSSQAGINALYNKFVSDDKNKNINVISFRTGHAWEDFKARFPLVPINASLHTDVVYQHTLNVVKDAIGQKGLFVDSSYQEKGAVKKIVLVGFSFGAGTVHKLQEDLKKAYGSELKISTLYIDPIKLGGYYLGSAITERPQYSERHGVIYQDEDYMLPSSAPDIVKEELDDFCIKVYDTEHDGTDNASVTLSYAERFALSECLF